MMGDTALSIGGNNLHYRRNPLFVGANTLMIGAGRSLSSVTP
jgi:hypothetical protein